MSNTSFPDMSIFTYFSFCFNLQLTYKHFAAFTLVNVPFVLPLSLYILRLGVQRWRAGARISHTDFFTYNMVVVLLLNILASCALTTNLFLHSKLLILICIYTMLITYSAIIIFQILTCLERYLAVVHPVTYLSLKSQTWTLIRNLSCGYVWLQCFIQSIYFSQMKDFVTYFTVHLLLFTFSFLVVLFCNLCVLCVLKRPRPGDGAKANRSTQKALHTIRAVTATLLVKFGGDVFSTTTFLIFSSQSTAAEMRDKTCSFYFSFIWFTLPSSLVLPMLFLHRNKKLLCFKTKKQQPGVEAKGTEIELT